MFAGADAFRRFYISTTFVAGLRLDGIVTPMMIDAPINGRSFRTYVEKVLIPELQSGDIVIMDNLGATKRPSTAR